MLFRLSVQKHLHGFIVPVVDYGSLTPCLAFLLELEVFLKHRGETIPFKKSNFLYDLLMILWNVLQVEEQRHAIT